MPRVSAVFIDLSGTLHVDSEPIPNAVSALDRLRRECPGLKIRFVTNTTKESINSLLDKLTRLGFDIPRNELFTSLLAARKLVERLNLRPLLFLEEEAMNDFIGITTDEPNSVVIGLAPSCFHYEKLNQAYHILSSTPDPRLIAIHKSPTYLTSDPPSSSNFTSSDTKKTHIHSLGPGPFVTLLESVTSLSATVVGKPSPSFFAEAVHSCGLAGKEAEIWMIGDDIVSDISGIKKIGGNGILVQTGKYKSGDEGKLKGVTPDVVVKDFAEAVDVVVKTWKEDH
ncbi:HAD-like domain-containing protein [Paraphysoderma sedebokerense]|nr:HAD-like domain-containing protein [Paraphysoderma sedebokerense]